MKTRKPIKYLTNLLHSALLKSMGFMFFLQWLHRHGARAAAAGRKRADVRHNAWNV